MRNNTIEYKYTTVYSNKQLCIHCCLGASVARLAFCDICARSESHEAAGKYTHVCNIILLLHPWFQTSIYTLLGWRILAGYAQQRSSRNGRQLQFAWCEVRHFIHKFMHIVVTSFFLCFFLSFFLSFFFIRHNRKTILCMQILNIPNDCSGDKVYSDLLWASDELQLAGYWHETVSISTSHVQ